MIKTIRRVGLGSIAAWTILLQIAHGGDLDAATNLYGRGVHAYFAGHASQAESLLSRAMGFQADDPRMFYFRALSRLQLGRIDEAVSDMSIGAEIESERLNQYAVGAALQRVQGGDRLLLEKYRRQGQAQAAQARDQIAAQQHQQITGHDSSVLRQRVVVPLDEFLRPGVPRALSAEELSRREAAASGPASPAPRPAVVNEPPPATPVEEPIVDEAPAPAPQTPPPPTTPEPSRPDETPPQPDEDPFLDFQ